MQTIIINKFTAMETFENNKSYKHRYGKSNCHNSRHHYILGVVLIIIGAALVLKNMGIFPYCVKNIIFSWQMLLVVIGLVITLGSSGEKTGGAIILAVGVFFLIPKIFYGIFNVNIFWPLIFIIVGLIFIFSRRVNARVNLKGHSEARIGDNFIDIVNIFSGSEKKIMSDNFNGGRITSIFGGSEIDLTQAKLAHGVSVLEITCVFGGTTITVPSDWNVKVEITPVLGGFDERQVSNNRSSVDMSKLLVIKGIVVFGGGEIYRN